VPDLPVFAIETQLKHVEIKTDFLVTFVISVWSPEVMSGALSRDFLVGTDAAWCRILALGVMVRRH